MKLILDNIEDIIEIKPHFKSTYEGAKIQIEVSTSQRRKEDLVYEIWEDLGDELFFKLLENEGYKIERYDRSRL